MSTLSLYRSLIPITLCRYTLLTLFSKYGTITSLDYLFHKSGPSRGKPRGFAFVEFAEQAVSFLPAPFHYTPFLSPPEIQTIADPRVFLIYVALSTTITHLNATTQSKST